MSPQTLGRIASYYYLTHLTMRMFQSELGAETSIPELIEVLSVSHGLCFQTMSIGKLIKKIVIKAYFITFANSYPHMKMV